MWYEEITSLSPYVYALLAMRHMTHYGQTGRHPQNRKHISLSSEDDKATATVNVYRKLNEVFVFDMRADRDVQTRPSQYWAPIPRRINN